MSLTLSIFEKSFFCNNLFLGRPTALRISGRMSCNMKNWTLSPNTISGYYSVWKDANVTICYIYIHNIMYVIIFQITLTKYEIITCFKPLMVKGSILDVLYWVCGWCCNSGWKLAKMMYIIPKMSYWTSKLQMQHIFKLLSYKERDSNYNGIHLYNNNNNNLDAPVTFPTFLFV